MYSLYYIIIKLYSLSLCLFTCFQAKLQVVLGDDEDGHGLDEEEKGKGDAEGTLTPFLQPEVMGSEGEENLSGETQVKDH